MTSRDDPKGGNANKRKSSTSPRDAEVASSFLRNSRNVARLAPEEEVFHSRQFFEYRSKLGLLLSHFPRVVADQIAQCKTTEIQQFNEDGDLDHYLVDEKREQIVSLLEALEAVSHDLERMAEDRGKDAAATRELLHESLERLLEGYVFHSRFYDACMKDIDELAERLNDGNARKRAVARILMPPAEFGAARDELQSVFDTMQLSRQTLLEANLGLVVSVVRKYSSTTLSFQDLFQEGYLGLVVAVDKFQPKMGHRFSTYAVWWIRQGVTQALSSTSRTIRIPANMARALSRINRAEQGLLQKLGREPSPEEIAEAVDIPVERVRAWRKMERQPISLESPIGENDRGQVIDLIVDRKAESPAEITSSKLLTETITKVLHTLSDREREIIIHRFGLLNKSQMTLEELSKRFHVTHERIRQIEAAALKKLRDPGRREYFDGYY